MRKATLTRVWKDFFTTIGVVTTDTSHQWWSLEPSWKDNKVNISCIPAGLYSCRYEYSRKFAKLVYFVEMVPNRTNIEIHTGNSHADTSGCILLGRFLNFSIGDSPTLGNSEDAIDAFRRIMQVDFITLEVVEAFQEPQPMFPKVPSIPEPFPKS